MLHYDVALASVMGQEVMPEIDELAAFGQSRVSRDANGRLVIHEEGGGCGLSMRMSWRVR